MNENRSSDRPSREAFAKKCRLLYERHLVVGVGGNMSARIAGGFLTTPSGICLRDMTPETVLALDARGEPPPDGRPTREFSMHRCVFDRRPDVRIVCHVHGSWILAASTMFAPGQHSIPPVTPGFCFFAYPLPLLPFQVPGSPELATAVGEAFSNSSVRAVLMQNHGLITVGEDLVEAINIAEEIDEAAQVYMLTRGKCTTIPEELIRQITTYAQAAAGG